MYSDLAYQEKKVLIGSREFSIQAQSLAITLNAGSMNVSEFQFCSRMTQMKVFQTRPGQERQELHYFENSNLSQFSLERSDFQH